jgi:heat shock protein HslJ
MMDDPETKAPNTGDTPGTGEPRGFMVYLAIALIAILVILVFFVAPPGQGTAIASAITENTWSLQSFSNPDGTSYPVMNGTVITALFSPEGKLTGSGGCTPYSARYMLHDTAIVVSRVSGSSSCHDNNLSHQELQYYASIEDAAFLRVNNRVLTFYGTNGKPLLIFTPAKIGN